jgi:hypothetical protein
LESRDLAHFFSQFVDFGGKSAEELYIQDIFPEQELANQSEVSSFGDSVEEGARYLILGLVYLPIRLLESLGTSPLLIGQSK